jgi:hypothetical protein
MQAKINEGTGEVSIYFRESELRLAIWNIEALACTLEESGFNTEKMWEFAKQLRGLNADKNGQPLFCDINGN